MKREAAPQDPSPQEKEKRGFQEDLAFISHAYGIHPKIPKSNEENDTNMFQLDCVNGQSQDLDLHSLYSCFPNMGKREPQAPEDSTDYGTYSDYGSYDEKRGFNPFNVPKNIGPSIGIV